MERQQTSEDAVMTRIGQAVMLLHGGDREEARNRLGALWAEIGESGRALHRCTLAHYMADTQDDPGDELAWDLRALTAAEGQDGGTDGGGDGDVGEGGAGGGGGAAAAEEEAGAGGAVVSSAVRAFYPALHLNLAADYAKLQRPEAARLHLDRARDAADALGDAGYGHGVRAGIARLERTLRARGR
ncbi:MULTISPECIES: hypothetical protein [unclassified Streptomyces]|uniref:hypothetical protein n=1 Tax=unclassified Streptomyces TaxID=2593676 RepID=UPI002E2A1C15|nr:hypothetical protein [Streptomyces sp. NBC_01429]